MLAPERKGENLWMAAKGYILTRFLNGRDSALRCPRPERSGGRNACQTRVLAPRFRRLTLRSATGTAQRAIPTADSVKRCARGQTISYV
jgi:hypothetical protein